MNSTILIQFLLNSIIFLSKLVQYQNGTLTGLDDSSIIDLLLHSGVNLVKFLPREQSQGISTSNDDLAALIESVLSSELTAEQSELFEQYQLELHSIADQEVSIEYLISGEKYGEVLCKIYESNPNFDINTYRPIIQQFANEYVEWFWTTQMDMPTLRELLEKLSIHENSPENLLIKNELHQTIFKKEIRKAMNLSLRSDKSLLEHIQNNPDSIPHAILEEWHKFSYQDSWRDNFCAAMKDLQNLLADSDVVSPSDPKTLQEMRILEDFLSDFDYDQDSIALRSSVRNFCKENKPELFTA